MSQGYTNPDAKEHIEAILRDLEAGIVQGPVAAAEAFERYTAPEYVFTSAAGVLSRRAAVLEDLRNGTVRFGAFRMSEIDIRLYDRVAVVVGRAEGDGVNPGGEVFRGAYRFTSVWHASGSDWKLVAWQTTAVSPGG